MSRAPRPVTVLSGFLGVRKTTRRHGARNNRNNRDGRCVAGIAHQMSELSIVADPAGAATTNACRRFHTDAITARLSCTCRGLGTQHGIAQGGCDPSRAFSVPTGAPNLLRGTDWPDQPSPGPLHRFPPIKGTGETGRVLGPVHVPEHAP